MVRVKICGVRRLEDAFVAVEAGADAIGLNFWRPGRRYVAPEAARVIARALPPFVARVGVFADEDAETIRRIADLCGLDALQLHGEESPEFCRQFERPVIKSIKVRSAESLDGLARFAVSAFLLDTHVPGEMGGTGRAFDWGLAARAKAAGPVILSGGLTPENVGEAIRAAAPYAVDVASGVETAGEKDPAKIRAFIARVQEWNAAEVRR
jgi:phosphoribosylanthranilate isomerase